MKRRNITVTCGAGLLAAIPTFPLTLPSTALCADGGTRVAFVQAPVAAGQPAGRDTGNTILADQYRTGMRVVVADLDDFASTLRCETDGFICATDPVYSYDARRLAFCGQKTPEQCLQVWEIVEGTLQTRPAVKCDADCIQPAYLANGGFVVSSPMANEYEEHSNQYSFSLYAAGAGGEVLTRLTFNPSSDFEPDLLPDGRMVYSSWQHVGNHHWPRGTVALMLINADGTGLFPLTGNHRDPWLKRCATPIGDNRVAFIMADRADDFASGTLVTTSLNDPFGPYQTLVRPDEYLVTDLAPMPDGRLLLSARPTDGSRATFGLYVYKDGVVSALYDDPDRHDLSPAIGEPVTPPDTRVSTVVPGTTYGYVAVLNCYDTDRTDQHPLRPDAIKAVRVIEGMPVRHTRQENLAAFSRPDHPDEPMIRPNSATGQIPSRILGEVRPAADGSIYLKVPADRPLRMQLVDQEGFTIVNERGWFWVRPNERRICIGCHENRELSPRNASPLAVRRLPTDLSDGSDDLTVSFRRDIRPIITQTCAASGCHVSPRPAAGMNLGFERRNGDRDGPLAEHYDPAYANLLRRQDGKPFAIGGRRVHPGDARSSPLLWMLYGRHLAAQYAPAPFDRPVISAHPGPMLPEAQLAKFRMWVDLGAPYDDDSPPGPWTRGNLANKTEGNSDAE